MTYATFKPCCDKLKDVLQNTYLSNPNYKENKDDVIDIVNEIEMNVDEEEE